MDKFFLGTLFFLIGVVVWMLTGFNHKNKEYKKWIIKLGIVLIVINAFYVIFIAPKPNSKYTTLTFEFAEMDQLVDVTLLNDDGYSLIKNTDGTFDTFDITKNGELVCSAPAFIGAESMDGFFPDPELEQNLKKNEIIEEDTKDNLEYVFYSASDDTYTYYIYGIRIDNLNFGVLVSSDSENQARECFNRLQFTIKDK